MANVLLFIKKGAFNLRSPKVLHILLECALKITNAVKKNNNNSNDDNMKGGTPLRAV